MWPSGGSVLQAYDQKLDEHIIVRGEKGPQAGQDTAFSVGTAGVIVRAGFGVSV